MWPFVRARFGETAIGYFSDEWLSGTVRPRTATSPIRGHMYEISRELFRELRPGLVSDRHDPARPARTLLAICEDTVRGVATLPAARALHAKRLFAKARALFPPSQHLSLIQKVDAAVAVVHARLVAQSDGRSASLLRCAATTRRHVPCMREPIPGERFCPSHRRDATPLPGSRKEPGSFGAFRSTPSTSP